jgi:SET domain-containing protein
MFDNTYVKDSKIHGKGLFASGSIPAGRIIGWLRGNPSNIDGPYVLWIGEYQGIEVLCNLKYINHSDDPNACYYDDLSVVALRDIEPNEEITHNYYSNDW